MKGWAIPSEISWLCPVADRDQSTALLTPSPIISLTASCIPKWGFLDLKCLPFYTRKMMPFTIFSYHWSKLVEFAPCFQQYFYFNVSCAPVEISIVWKSNLCAGNKDLNSYKHNCPNLIFSLNMTYAHLHPWDTIAPACSHTHQRCTHLHHHTRSSST